jgi:hypothetical protein
MARRENVIVFSWRAVALLRLLHRLISMPIGCFVSGYASPRTSHRHPPKPVLLLLPLASLLPVGAYPLVCASGRLRNREKIFC